MSRTSVTSQRTDAGPAYAPAQFPAAERRTLAGWLRKELPYVLLMILGLVGISWTSIAGGRSTTYWVMLVPVAALICIVAGWTHFATKQERVRLVATQLAQWAAILIAMYLMLRSDVRGLLNDDAIGLTLLVLLALSTFISGLHVRVWQLCVVGGFLALAVPVIASTEQGVLLLLLIAIALILLGFVHWWVRSRRAGAHLA